MCLKVIRGGGGGNQIREICKIGMSGKELRIELSWHMNWYIYSIWTRSFKFEDIGKY